MLAFDEYRIKWHNSLQIRSKIYRIFSEFARSLTSSTLQLDTSQDFIDVSDVGEAISQLNELMLILMKSVPFIVLEIELGFFLELTRRG